ncbi:MAG: flippase-like domain-containing protein [Lachnospiraceae bacterium]|nr:flippase-like domain-containing protein [Lachnospiraceae bacterium]
MKQNKTSIKNILSLVFIIGVFIGLVLYILYTDGIAKTRMVLESADYKWILIGLLSMTGIYLFESLVLYIPLKKQYKGLSFPITVLSIIVCRFFNIITPFSTGGQPFQAYMLSRYGLRVSDTLSAMTIKYVIYQIGLFAWALVLLIGNYSFFIQTFHNDLWLVLLGTGVNLIVTIVAILIGLNETIIMKIAHAILKALSHLHIGCHYMIRDPEGLLQKTDDTIHHYCLQFKQAKYNKSTLIQMSMATMLQIICNISIPYAVYRAFDNTGFTYFQILTTQIYLHLMIAYVPTPGSSLGAEGGFALLYRSIFKNGLNPAMFFWRSCTFFFPFFAGCIASIITRKELINKRGN